MAQKGKESPEMSPEKALALLTEVRNRLSTVAWALHGMHHESEPPGPDDLAACPGGLQLRARERVGLDAW